MFETEFIFLRNVVIGLFTDVFDLHGTGALFENVIYI